MPIVKWTKQTRREGIQTFANVCKLPEPLQRVELEYLNIRDYYLNQLAIKAQFDEALHQAKLEGNKEDAKLFAGKAHGIQSTLVDMRERVKEVAERSYTEAYYLAAKAMLPHDIHQALEEQATALLGRPRHEIARQG